VTNPQGLQVKLDAAARPVYDRRVKKKKAAGQRLRRANRFD
jgi:hypothetical protein